MNTFSQRYLEDSGGTPEALDSGGRQSLLTTAVENCFIGQSFVFGVTVIEIDFLLKVL